MERAILSLDVQFAVEAEHHLILAHDVIKAGNDRLQLSPMGQKALKAAGTGAITVLVDHGY